MNSLQLQDQISDFILSIVRKQAPDLADLIDLAISKSEAEQWKEAGSKLLEQASKAELLADAQFWFMLATICFERYVGLSREAKRQQR